MNNSIGMRCGIATWLLCMWKVRRLYRKKGLLFSHRIRFLEELRPKVSPMKADEGVRIAYPDAIFWITPKDVKRAAAAITLKRAGGHDEGKGT